jgi:regulator of cell morphogenesis and NO signaling
MKTDNNIISDDTLTVAQLAIFHPGALSVFTRYNIDYCCGGHRTLTEACHRIGLDPEKIREEIYSQQTDSPDQSFRPERWSSSLLVDFIIQNHHTYVKRAIPELEALLDKVCHRHGDESIELLNIRERFLDLAEDLTSHMEKEELVLFPAIKRLEANKAEDNPLAITIQPPIAAMEHEHTAAGDLVKQIRVLSDNYTPPEYACPTFRITYKKLQEFSNDLFKHIHLENNILFERYKHVTAL